MKQELIEKLLIIAIKRLGGSITISEEEFVTTQLEGSLTEIHAKQEGTITFVYDKPIAGK